jgi:twitching motility protein PilT
VARIDSILSIADRQGANELRLGSDREPQMFADGTQKRLAMPKTPTETLRELLGELLPPDREKMLAAQGQVQFLYEAGALGPYRVALTRRGPPGALLEIDAVFQRGRGKAAPAPPLLAPPPAAPQPALAVARAPVAEPAARPAEPSTAAQPAVESPSPELAALLGRALSVHASDVHVLDGEPPLVRVGGKLRPLGAEPASDVAHLLGPALAELARRRLATGASLDVALGIEGVGRFRLNAYTTASGLAAAIRVLQSSPPALGELGLPVPLDDIVDLPHGLVIVAGATGSGKTTTLAALAQEALRRRPGMLLTLEDPIEYVLSSRGGRGACRQRQIGRDVKDFATGLRDALREDPDVLLIGEMRDPETITLALTAAETGHLVLASLHSRGAAAAIERIVDSYPAERHHQVRVQLADALRVVVAQRLVPRAGAQGGDGAHRESRVLAAEVLRVNHAAASAIRDAKTAGVQSAIQAGRREGMLPLERCLADLVQRQRVSLEDARAAANDPAVLASYLTGSPG